jgi:crotonobetainyl-CoA:carnitine CoA-transferase CaiB-like acyl-CoA transferase
MEWVQNIRLPGTDTETRTFVSPLRINGVGLPVRLAPPALGEHNDSILHGVTP